MMSKRGHNMPSIVDSMRTSGALRPSDRSAICSALKREYVLMDLLPNESFMSHIFIGFTQNGQHFLSYSKSDESNQIQLHIFRFNGGRPLDLVASHVIYTGNWFHSTEFADSRLFEGVYCYQWSSDDNYLLTVVAPQYPNSKLIDVTLIRIDRFGSYVVSPGSQTFNCNGFGRIPDFCDDKSLNESTIEELLYPKIILSQPKICALITDSEIVFFEIKEQSNYRTGLLDARFECKLLDVESHIFGDVFSKHLTNLFSYVSEYELLVYDINLFSQNNEQEVHKSYYSQLVDMIRSNRLNTYYSINNLSLTETHKSLTRLHSPADAFTISLN
ncbi:unnamed protein product [Medioppia subpectinata]|uniref:DDB1- and CUL4-associated factor 15 WD40 repeat-containing domain-containing protein n=1 Tax=Medioppia subpectinata TaxID=1979941 RepID=A0A7R9Q476_9ACAR|nr:unnamed protein product [Medioppia subpectinata]CAG2111180.1 unnamed protein product [Medioppia subpectinata]